MQVFVFAVASAISKAENESLGTVEGIQSGYCLVFSICTSVLMCGQELNEASFAVQWVWSLRNWYLEAKASSLGENLIGDRASAEYSRCQRQAFGIIVIAVMVLLFTMHAVVRLIFVFVCEDSM